MDNARRGSAAINPLAAPCVIGIFDWIFFIFPSAILFALLSSFALKP